MEPITLFVLIVAVSTVYGMDDPMETGTQVYNCIARSEFEPMDIPEILADAGSLHANSKIKSLCDCIMIELNYAKPDNSLDVPAIKAMIPDKYNKSKVEAGIDECVKISENNNCRFILCISTNTYTDMMLM